MAEDEKQFSSRILAVGNHAYTSLSLTLGWKLGLLEVMGKLKQPSTSHEIANIAKLKERYVREWLGVMVCSDIVEIDEKSEKYWLPEHRYKVLTGPGNMPTFLWSLTLIGKITPDIMQCFLLDGPNGMPYSKYEGFHEWREQRTNTKYKLSYTLKLLEMVPGLIQALENGSEFCDIGCSTGFLLQELAGHFTNSKFHGFDIGEDAVDIARQRATERNITNATFDVMDVFKMPASWTNKWQNLLVADVIHDLPYPDLALREICRVLKPGGYFLMLDIAANTPQRDNKDNPLGPLLYTMSLFHCMPVSLYCEGGMGLGTCWGRQKAKEMIEDAGFNLVSEQAIGIEEIYVCQKPA